MSNKNVERGQATRAHLVEVATRLFSERGYDGTSIEAVLAESGASRGSLYHHFPGKDALFWAVLENVGARIATRIEEAAREAGDDPVAALRARGLAWIRLAGDQDVRQVMLTDAPAVLGWKRWREADEPGLAVIRSALAHAADEGRIEALHVDAFAHVVLATASEVALMIAESDDPATTSRAGESAFTAFLDRLLGPAPAS